MFKISYFDAFTIWTNKHTDTLFLLILNNILAVIHLGFVGAVAPIYYLFILSITHEQKKISKKYSVFTSIVFGYDLLTLITSPFTHFLMYYNESGEYVHGPLFFSFYAVTFIFMIAGIIELIRNFKKISKKKIHIILFFTIAVIITSVYQFFNPHVLLMGFSSGISLIVISFTLKNPMELIDTNIGLYNRTAFKEYLFSHKINRTFVIVHIKNGDVIKYTYGLDNGYTMIRKCTEKLLKECHQKLGFYIFNDTFVFICKNEQEVYDKLSIFEKHRTQALKIQLDDDQTFYDVYFDFDAFLVKDPQLLIDSTEVDSKKNTVDQILDIIKYLTETIKDFDGVKIIDEEIIKYYKQKVQIQKTVDKAIADESFEVFLQPIYDLKLKCFSGAESLIRLRDADGKFISPALFIPEAEKNGEILTLGDISIKRTCEFIRDGKLQELGIQKVNINLSMVQCMQDNITNHIISILDNYDIPKEMIRFEITETMTATNPQKLNNVMTELSKYGIEFALDDYGTGYSNTSRLLEFPFSEIKFDKSFVDSAMENKRNSLPLKHLMNMVSDSNMLVLVEGVETKEMSELIEQFGGNLIQGFYYAKPLPLNDFVEFIQKNNPSKLSD